MSVSVSAAPAAASVAAPGAHASVAAAPAAPTVPAADPNEVISIVVAQGRTIYLPRGTHPFRGGNTITGKRRDIFHLVDAGHATLKT